jgi:hypothetical protein
MAGLKARVTNLIEQRKNSGKVQCGYTGTTGHFIAPWMKFLNRFIEVIEKHG